MRHADDCRRAVQTAVEHLGRLDILVHNAGGPSPGTIDEVAPEQWLATIDLHVNANYFLCRAALPFLRRQPEGAIVTVSSTAGIRGVPGAIAYATAKGAVPQFTRALARDLADDNIRVNCVAPGVIRTRFHADMSDGTATVQSRSSHPAASRRYCPAGGRRRRPARSPMTISPARHS